MNAKLHSRPRSLEQEPSLLQEEIWSQFRAVLKQELKAMVEHDDRVHVSGLYRQHHRRAGECHGLSVRLARQSHRRDRPHGAPNHVCL